MVLLYIMIILFFQALPKATPLLLWDDRWLKLQEPLIYGQDVKEIQTQLKT